MAGKGKPPYGTDQFYKYVGLRHYDRQRAAQARKDERIQRRIEELQDRLTALEKINLRWLPREDEED